MSVHTQFRDVLRGPEDTEVNLNHEENTAVGFGVECEFWERIAIRAGYYFENRPNGTKEDGRGTWVTDNKRGFTGGIGSTVPLDVLSVGKLPFNAKVDLVVQPQLKELGNKYTPPAYFTESDLLFSLGIGLQWVR